MSAVLELSRAQRREAQRELKKSNQKYPNHLVLFDFSRADAPTNLINVMRSRDYLVQIFTAPLPCVCRLSINRTSINGADWSADIPWEDLQRLKNEAGYATRDAVEVFPSNQDVVNVANMRHLWIMDEQLGFAWRKS